MQKSVSVIVACYNEEKYIERCLKTLLGQTYTSMEIIVVDDGSVDKTAITVKKIKDIRFFKLRHHGTAITRNFAASKATGEILVFVDADMEFPSTFISRLVQPINDGKTKGTFSRLEYVKNWNKPLARCWNRNSNPHLPDGLRVLQTSVVGEDFRAILKSEFLRVGGFDDTGYTDTWSLEKKLRYKPFDADDASYYHNNPETYAEIFQSSQWIGKREYKLGFAGTVFTIIRSFFLFSIIKGMYTSFRFQEPHFLPFQIVYDWGITVGALNKIFLGTVSK